MLIQATVKQMAFYHGGTKLSHPFTGIAHSYPYMTSNSYINKVRESRRFSTSQQGLGFDPKVNYYKILDVTETASEHDIKKSFYLLAKKYHPDSSIQEGHDKKQQLKNEERFKEISNAYEVLSDKQRKSSYDELRK